MIILQSGRFTVVPPGPQPEGLRVPFDSTSVWNEPLDTRFPSGVPIHPESNLMIEAIRRSMSGAVVGTARYFKFTSDTGQFSQPIYVVTDTTPMATVRYSGVRGESSDAGTTRFFGGGTLQVPVDPTWRPGAPNLNNDSNSDSQIIVWDMENVLGHPDGPQFWDFWRAKQNVTGVTLVSGTWKQNVADEYECVNCSHFTGEYTSSGVPGNTPDAYVSRGAGTPYMAGLVRRWELDAAVAVEGGLDHAISAAFSEPDGTFVPPASKSDGGGIGDAETSAGNPYSGPEGMLVRLDPRFDVAALVDPQARVVARTLQTHGVYMVDNAGRPKMFLEANESAGWPVVPVVDLLGQMPLEALHVVDWTGTGGGNDEWGAALPVGGIGGTPAILGTVVGTSAGSTAIVTSASQTPNEGELLLAIVSEKNIESIHVADVTGNGMVKGWQAGEWRSYCHHGIYFDNNRNAWGEIYAAVAPAGVTAGEVTVTTTSAIAAAQKALQVLRLTAGSRPIRVAVSDVNGPDSSTISLTLKSPASGNLLIAIVMHRLGTVNNNATGWTENVRNTVGGTTAHVSTWTRVATGADVTFSPTLSSATEWIAFIVEVT